MPSTWNDSLKIGVPLIDMQHKQLFDQLDRLVEALDNDKSDREIQGLLKFLDAYVSNHFQYEESCMNLYHCPVACQNKQAHSKFVNTVQEIHKMIAQKQSSKVISTRIKRELSDWFVRHIQGIDVKLEPYANNKDKAKVALS